ncbi:hypothetical protein TBLA_0D00710 [Henningerozyma blattae CBS 6284]|uniref:Uncharacterized protein n=1 Tax=Henningerozyma blattae (strain ATCC 34711 / CBS 6284 / DSM 70876 / NBRC 10599 / NRRL Y-10934 / UCD 77-7) TaxID=1071380 RepID=I2H2H7_HENB6|nr:hypothetical protein TBLA_0D00710 [Tetrapisispora blattae CBS 6284]CCH60579.1 hypothetical protein TBLA_0D00710 [Tetrapisispora blattae CBS 6284]
MSLNKVSLPPLHSHLSQCLPSTDGIYQPKPQHIPRVLPPMPSLTIYDQRRNTCDVSPLDLCNTTTANYNYTNPSFSRPIHTPLHRVQNPEKSILSKTPKRYIDNLPPINLYVSSVNGTLDDATIYGTELNVNLFKFNYFKNIMNRDDMFYININPMIRNYRKKILREYVFNDGGPGATLGELDRVEGLGLQDTDEEDTAVIHGVLIDESEQERSGSSGSGSSGSSGSDSDSDSDYLSESSSDLSSLFERNSAFISDTQRKIVRFNENDIIYDI